MLVILLVGGISLSQLIDFSVFNESGQPIDLEHINLTLTIQITELNDRLVGHNLNTRRGVVDYATVSDQQIVNLRANADLCTPPER